jgi:hypothetical protein
MIETNSGVRKTLSFNMLHDIISRNVFVFYQNGTIMLFRNLTLFYLCFLLLIRTVYSQSELPTASLKPIPHSRAYLSGRDAGSSRIFFGTFATGLAFGASLPFAAGGSGAWAYQSTGDSNFMGVTVGLSTGAIWVWSGSRLTRLPSIRVPARRHTGLNEQERTDFDAGYLSTARERRSAQYNFGVTIGVLIPMILFLEAMKHLGPLGV